MASDEARVSLWPKPVLRCPVGGLVVDQRIGIGQQGIERQAIGRKIHHHGVFVEAEIFEQGGLPVRKGTDPAQRAAFGRFDGDHLCAEIGQQARGITPCNPGGEVDDSEALKRRHDD